MLDLLENKDNQAIRDLRARELDLSVTVGRTFTIGEIVDLAAGTEQARASRDKEIAMQTTVGQLMDLVGEEKVKTFLEEKAARASYTEDYEYTAVNVIDYWLSLVMFVFAFAILATITLEFIDKDKR